MTKNQPLAVLKLAVIASVITAIYFPWRTSASQDQNPPNSKSDIVGYGATMEARLGKDDGTAFVIHFMGDTHGSLETCGCKAKLSGGVARRQGYIEAFKRQYKDIPELMVDSGGFLSDVRTDHGMLISYAITQDEWMLKAYDRFRVDVANLSDHDFKFVSTLATGEEGETTGNYPVMDRMISANAAPEGQGITGIKPYIIEQVAAREPGSTDRKTVRVAFIGLCDAVGGDAAPVKGVRVLDPVATARSTVAALRGKADVIVVLAHVRTKMAMRIAKEVPGIDMIIAGNAEIFTPSARVGQTLVAFTPFEATMIGEARFYHSDKGFSVRERYIGIDTGIPESPEAKDFAEAAKKAISAQYKPLLKLRESAANPTGGGSAVPAAGHTEAADKLADYVSAQACLKCHTAQYSSWAKSEHAQAMTSLAAKMNQMDIRCLSCHTTGYIKGGPIASPKTMTLLNVQCELCHGPGRAHVANPDKSYGHMADVEKSCSACHTVDTSPQFNLKEALAKIKH